MRAILICPTEDLRNTFEKTVQFHPAVRLTKAVGHYPEEDDLRRLVRVWAPDIIFLDIQDAEEAQRVSRQLDTEFGTVQRVALSQSEDPGVFRFALENRMSELLVPPFDADRFVQMLKRLAEHLKQHPAQVGTQGEIYAFLPAKGGVGASTIAANTAWALAKVPEANVLLADFDIYSGVTGFMFGTDHTFSIHDAASRIEDLDDDFWQRIVKKVGDVDLLLSGAPMLEEGLSAKNFNRIFDFARRTYSAIGVDLPDTLDDRSMSVMREATRIFLVTTPDLASLRLARHKALALTRLELDDKVKLLVNRVSRRMELTIEQIETSVGMPVFSTFPCNYADVTRATHAAKESPKLAPSIKEFVEKLSEKKASDKKRARFIERFALVPARYGFR
jgi:pilus assembly protein CpaE